MIAKQLEQISKDDIDALVTNSVSEGRTLEYKLTLPGNLDADKKEFLADVSSFANAGGGDLIYGIGVTNGVATTTPGLAVSDPDAEIQRLDAIIRSGIEPRIPSVRIWPIDGFASGPVFAVRVAKSFAPPHMVTFKGTSRFYTRNNAGKYQMDVGEIRAAFVQSESLPERIRDFRTDRLGKVLSGETTLPLLEGGKIALHLIPIQSFMQPPSLDMRAAAARFFDLRPLYSSGSDRRLNLDGLLTFELDQGGKCLGYAQLFRNGVIETVDCVLLDPRANESRTVPTVAYERELIRSVIGLLEFQKELDVLPPIVILVSFLGVKNYSMTVHPSPLHRGGDLNRIDRDVLLLPEVLVDDYNAKPERFLRPVFDAVWQSAGFPGSPNFDSSGNWIGKG